MKKLLLVTAVCAIAALPIVGAQATPVPDLHCPGKPGAPPATILYEGTDGSVVLAAGTTFCVKAALDNSGVVTADGTKTVQDYVTWLNPGGQTPGVSYFVVYTVPPTPTPTPTTPPPTTPPPTTPPPTPPPTHTPPPHPTPPPTTPPPTVVPEPEPTCHDTGTCFTPDKPPRCERPGNEDVKACQPKTHEPPQELAFTGLGSAEGVLAGLAVLFVLLGLALILKSYKRA